MKYERYTSDDLTHFVGRERKPPEECHRILTTILSEGRLRASGIPGATSNAGFKLQVTGNAKLSDESAVQGRIVCFCDIPRKGMTLHMKKYGRFGLAFLKPWLVANGANPVFYVAKDGIFPGLSMLPTSSGGLEQVYGASRAEILDHLHAGLMATSGAFRNAVFVSGYRDMKDLLVSAECAWSLLYGNVLAFVKPFDSTEPERSQKNFYMEREWRVYGDVEFKLSDVHRVILPTSYVRCFRKEFPALAARLMRVPDR